jgi:hypothetical protein
MIDRRQDLGLLNAVQRARPFDVQGRYAQSRLSGGGLDQGLQPRVGEVIAPPQIC